MHWDWQLTAETRRQLAIFAALAAVAGLAYWWMSAPSSIATVPVRIASAAPTASSSIFVDVQGAVRRPGVFRLPQGSRVFDAIRAAGGVQRGHRPGVNQARPLVDGEQLLIGAETAAAAARSASHDARVDINRADATQLDALPGIGPVLATRIVSHREAHGPFRTLRDLLQVPGIGDAKYADLAERVTVG